MKGLKVQRTIFAIAGMLFFYPAAHGQNSGEYIRKGNRLYQKNEYAGSEGMYRRAQTSDKASPDATFNLGDALYKQGRFGEATKEFTNTSSGGKSDSLNQAQSYYNLGNSLLKEQKFEESIRAYINSLKLDPDNLQTKYNLAYAQDQLKKQQEQSKDQKDQKQDQQKDQKKDQQKQDQNKDNQDQKQEQQQQPQQGQDQQQAISRDDAKRLLDALAANEKETQQKVQRDRAVKAKVRVIKNW
jgi:Ca-activated chloride channel family protein